MRTWYRLHVRKTQIGDPATAVAYVRVSKEDQHNGPDAQRAQIAAWAAREGVNIAQSHEDRLTSVTAIDRRPALLAALDALRVHRAGALVVAKRDRIARDVILASTVERLVKARGAELVSADGVARGEEPAAVFMRNILDSVAQLERGMIRDRTKRALAAKAARGELVGKAPYGFRAAGDGIHLELEPAEQAMLARVRALSAEGLSLRAIGRQMALEGLLNRVGKRFGTTEISRILHRRERRLACAHGHEHEPKREGSYCLRDECAAGRGTYWPERRIEWRVL